MLIVFVLQVMEQLTDHHYEILSVPEEVAANCIYIRGPAKVDYLLHPTAEECPNSIPVSEGGCTVKAFTLKRIINNKSLIDQQFFKSKKNPTTCF